MCNFNTKQSLAVRCTCAQVTLLPFLQLLLALLQNDMYGYEKKSQHSTFIKA